ncbi:DNA repair protein RadC [Deferribacter autotrophicus]|uniref:DNA repair protein RadC n=1 Tax=Deferribacter autotrophicus TaxID=500465 RepID=A0A5A8F0Z6_9BACT|nr:DNA repair protein RadC [Deferribacter autotrophicus]KAA0257026.1 DNA repair protein RadC [Deferribacter autotrophicus]
MSEKPYYLGHRKRLKERFKAHPESLQDYEIIELILGYVIRGKDVKPLAKKILDEVKGVANIFNVNEDIEGVGGETVLMFRLLQEFYRRVESAKVLEEKVFDNPEKVFKYLKYQIGFENVEKIAVLYLDSKNGLISCKIESAGTVNESYIPPREIVKKALLENAVSVILAHNHPSGNLTPSNGDKVFTETVESALSTVGIRLLDHIIVYKNGYLSFKKEGIL